MDWANERYVRLYVRDTADWLALPWQARILWFLLLRRMDRAGVIQVRPGSQRVTRVATLVEVPVEVVAPGIAALLEDGCLVESGLGYTAPNFLDAQETAATDAQRQRESRERRKARGLRRNRANGEDKWNPKSVTKGHDGSQRVTPSLAVPSLAVPSLPKHLSPKKPGRPRKEEKEPNPELKKLQGSMGTIFFEEMKEKYLHRGVKDTEALKRLQANAPNEEIERRWRWSLQENGYSRCATYTELADKWNHYSGMEPGDEKSRASRSVYP